jgi:hypothetical protein
VQLKDNPLQVLRIDGERKTGKGVENLYAESIQDGGKESLTGTIRLSREHKLLSLSPYKMLAQASIYFNSPRAGRRSTSVIASSRNMSESIK